MKNWLALSLAALLPTLPIGAYAKSKPGELEILGYIEKVRFDNPSIELNAKLDSGATTSSLNALNKESFEKDGKEWICFDVIDPEDEDNLVTFEAPVVRTVRIRRTAARRTSGPWWNWACASAMCTKWHNSPSRTDPFLTTKSWSAAIS